MTTPSFSPTSRRDFLKKFGAGAALTLYSRDLFGQVLADSPKGRVLETRFKGMADIEALCAVEGEGVEGVICGRAIYTGDLDFEAAQIRADELNG